MAVGAGRETKEDNIDLGVGIVLNKKYGEEVEKGDLLATLHLNDTSSQEEVVSRLKGCFEINQDKPKERRFIYDTIK
jgi:pyrimidine-nucleoside phosphorylase